MPEYMGYNFSGWYTDSELTKKYEPKEADSFEGTVTLYAKYDAATDTPYIVKYWQQNIENNEYTLVENDTESLNGTTGAQTQAVAKVYDGFFQRDGEVTQKTISADGKTEVNIYYDRNTITYTFDPYGGNWDGSTELITLKGRYGSKVMNKPQEPKREYCTFKGWSDTIPNSTYNWDDLKFDWDPKIVTVPETFGTKDINYFAKYEGQWKRTEQITIMPPGTPGSGGIDATYVLFGDYIQTKKTDEVVVDRRIRNETYHQIISEGIEYLGSDGSYYVHNSEKYCKIGPLKWRVITINYDGKGNTLLLAENIINVSSFGSTNNYKDSTIREWLIGTFLEDAFSENARNLIIETCVDNNEDTKDKVFLLSENEVKSYCFINTDDIDAARKRLPTDYLTTRTIINKWWLRSPVSNNYYNDKIVGVIMDDGSIETQFNSITISNNKNGVVPAIVVKLPVQSGEAQ